MSILVLRVRPNNRPGEEKKSARIFYRFNSRASLLAIFASFSSSVRARVDVPDLLVVLAGMGRRRRRREAEAEAARFFGNLKEAEAVKGRLPKCLKKSGKNS